MKKKIIQFTLKKNQIKFCSFDLFLYKSNDKKMIGYTKKQTRIFFVSP